MIRLPRLISDGMVVQTGRDVHVWGWSEPGKEIEIRVLEGPGAGDCVQQVRTVTGADGRFDGYLHPLKQGTSYRLCFSDEGGEIAVSDVVAGYVFFCSGQSNMELPMRRVADRYPQEMQDAFDPLIRTYKITEKTSYSGPLKNLDSGSWVSVSSSTSADFSAIAYFFAKEFRKTAGCAVGLINASLGGSRIAGWMSRDMLQGYDDLLAEADRYNDPDFYAGRIRMNEIQAQRWYQQLEDMDPGRALHWEQGTDETWLKAGASIRQTAAGSQEAQLAEGTAESVIMLPAMFCDTALAGFIGSVWFRKTFYADRTWTDTDARIWLGTIVDRDEVWINGTFLGRTEYQYPPRKYDVPAGVIHEGENTLVVRVVVDQGLGRFTPGKQYCLFKAGTSPEDTGRIDLAGQWTYREGARCNPAPETDFVNWKATGLYNAMTAPCHDYPVAAILWYQGESDTHEPYDYADLTRRQIEGYRAAWKDERLPYIYVQLPRFVIDLDSETQWPDLREKQRSSLAVPGTGMAVAYDLGEDNDLHPLEKKEVGRRLALLALNRCCGLSIEDSGPVPQRVTWSAKDGEIEIRIVLSHAQGLHAGPAEDGKDDSISDFELLDEDGNAVEITKIRLLPEESAAELICAGSCEIAAGCSEKSGGDADGRRMPRLVRYLYANTNRGRMIYNGDMLPMGPFCMDIADAASNAAAGGAEHRHS